MRSKIFFDENRRLSAAKWILRERVAKTSDLLNQNPSAKNLGLSPDLYSDLSKPFISMIDSASSSVDLLTAEARYAKSLYAMVSKCADREGFLRTPGEGNDDANRLLDHANYLCYGAASVSLHGLGISFSMAVLHGKTRRGGLVFDIADLIKDGLSLPCAFCAAAERKGSQKMREEIIRNIHNLNILPWLFDAIKRITDEC